MSDLSSTDTSTTPLQIQRPKPRRKKKREPVGLISTSRQCEKKSLMLMKQPTVFEVEGELSRTNRQFIHDQMWKKLYREYVKCGESSAMLFPYLDRIVKWVEKYYQEKGIQAATDIALITHIQGHRAIAWLTGNTERAMEEYDRIEANLKDYQLQEICVSCAVLMYNKFVMAMDMQDVHKASAAVEKASDAMSGFSPSTWTSLVSKMQSCMYDKMAHVQPKFRSEYQKMALESYTNAIHFAQQQYADGKVNDLYYPVIYTLEQCCILLDMPTGETLRDYRNTNIIYKRLTSGCVDMEKLAEAKERLQKVTQGLERLPPEYHRKLTERIYLARIYCNIREVQIIIEYCRKKVQNLLKSKDEKFKKEYAKVEDLLQRARNIEKEWTTHYKESDTEYSYCPHLATDIQEVLQFIEEEKQRYKILLDRAPIYDSDNTASSDSEQLVSSSDESGYSSINSERCLVYDRETL